MQKPFMRIPYTGTLPPPTIIPASARTASGAVDALVNFFTAPPSPDLRPAALPTKDKDADSDSLSSLQTPRPCSRSNARQTVLLTGAGVSVASGLADYRGTNGTYTLNKSYRPIYYNEFVASHEARKRYWARSFLGWTNLDSSKPNATHEAVRKLGELKWASSVITQNVDSFHAQAHPSLRTLELHGYLRALVCLTCHNEYPRSAFQAQLARLNPAWADFLAEMVASGALTTENPDERRRRGLRSNPDGDVDVPNAPYSTFRYPACPVCHANPEAASMHARAVKHSEGVSLLSPPSPPSPPRIVTDVDGAWLPASTGGILKPAVIMFGESIPAAVKLAAEHAVDEASRMLVLGSSLATYSAWRLVKRARERGMPLAIVNIGGVRGEHAFFAGVGEGAGADVGAGVGRRDGFGRGQGDDGVRCSLGAEEVMPLVVKELEERFGGLQ